MYNLEMWKLLVDCLLVVSLVYLSYRIVRAPGGLPTAARLAELEDSLRALITDSDQASRALSDSLTKRQHALERLLVDIDSAEHRVNRSMSFAEQKCQQLEGERNRADRSLENLRKNAERVPAERHDESPQVAAVEARMRPATVSLRDEYAEEMVEPRSFEAAPVRKAPVAAPVRAENLNIYGEPVRPAPAQTAMQSQPHTLASQVEKQVQPEPQVRQTLKHSIQDVYAAAEEMLRAGIDLQQISVRTNLPLQDLKMLAQVVSREAVLKERPAVEIQEVLPEEAEILPPQISEADKRLGVLGSIKRQVQVL